MEANVNEILDRLETVRGCLEFLKELADDLPDDALGPDNTSRIVNAHGQAAGALIYLGTAIEMLSGAK